MKKITPCLWFDKNAEEAVNYYLTIFPESKILHLAHYDETSSQAANMPVDSVMVIAFELGGNEFLALNGGPAFQMSPAISFIIECETQEEIDHFWYKLSDGGKTMACGWLTDKFGMTWQVTPTKLMEYMQDPDKEKSSRVNHAILKMTKIEIEPLEKAYRGEE